MKLYLNVGLDLIFHMYLTYDVWLLPQQSLKFFFCILYILMMMIHYTLNYYIIRNIINVYLFIKKYKICVVYWFDAFIYWCTCTVTIHILFMLGLNKIDMIVFTYSVVYEKKNSPEMYGIGALFIVKCTNYHTDFIQFQLWSEAIVRIRTVGKVFLLFFN